MIWLRSFLAGLAALVIAALLIGVVAERQAQLSDDSRILYFYSGTLLSLWWLPASALAVFAGGFYGSFRRGLRARKTSPCR